MILVDTALRAREAEGSPIRVGDGRRRLHGRRASRTRSSTACPACAWSPSPTGARSGAEHVFAYAGPEPVRVDDQAGARGRDPRGAARGHRGPVPPVPQRAGRRRLRRHGRRRVRTPVVLEAFRHGKDVVLMNAEIDATIGPILQVYAERHGVILSACDGDEPGVQMNLYRWVKGLGLEPRVIGNVKGLQDPYRNPTTQKGFAEQWGQTPSMVTSFADGSKISFEQAIVANATGLHGARSAGCRAGSSTAATSWRSASLYDVDELRELGGDRRLRRRHAADEGLLPRRAPRPEAAALPRALQDGDGPALLVLHPVPPRALRGADRDRAGRALPRLASRSRSAGPCRGVRRREARPQGRGDARRLRHVHDLRRGGRPRRCRSSATCPRGSRRAARCGATSPQDEVLTYDDVDCPQGRLADRLRAEQLDRFRGETWLRDLLRLR